MNYECAIFIFISEFVAVYRHRKRVYYLTSVPPRSERCGYMMLIFKLRTFNDWSAFPQSCAPALSVIDHTIVES